MANTFKNYTDTAVGTSPSTSYTVAASTTAVMIGMTVANITTSQITVDVQCAGVYLVKGAAITAGVWSRFTYINLRKSRC